MSALAVRTNTGRLRLAIQKSGRLSEKSLSLLEECGISFDLNKSKLNAEARNFPLDILFLRDDDIPGYVSNGVVDAGIVGLNVVMEKNPSLPIVSNLGFGKCRLSIAVPKDFEYRELKDLEGKKIATSYPEILQAFLVERGVSASIQEISGSVEIAPAIGLADAICDLVSSGGTLLANRLSEVERVLDSEAVLVSNLNSGDLGQKESEILKELEFRITTVNNSKSCKYIVLNSPNESLQTISDILPGIKSPTVVQLAEEGWSAIHAVVNEDVFWDVLGKLKEAGAEGITVMPIEKILV